MGSSSLIFSQYSINRDRLRTNNDCSLKCLHTAIFCISIGSQHFLSQILIDVLFCFQCNLADTTKFLKRLPYFLSIECSTWPNKINHGEHSNLWTMISLHTLHILFQNCFYNRPTIYGRRSLSPDVIASINFRPFPLIL